MRIRLFRDKEGYPRAERSKSCKVLALFLEAEIQQDQQWGQELIQIIDKVQNLKIDNWEETGNANTLLLTPEKAKIVNEFTNDTCDLSLNDLRQAILDWLTFIKQS
jgi:uncharacterized protein YacL (UPF0231 family)